MGGMPYAETIGTPLTASATRVMLLGSGALSKELALSFQRLGVEVHAVDRVRHAPAQQVAHVAHVMDVSDPEAVTELIGRVRPHYIIPEVNLVAVDVLEAAEATRTAMVVPSAKAAALSTNREGVRRLASEELGLPTASYRFVSELMEFEVAVGSIGFPCVAKADAESPGARAHRVIRRPEEVRPAWEELSGQSRRVVVEKMVDFDFDVTILAVRSVDPETGRLATWFCEPIGHAFRNGEYAESWQPLKMNPAALDNARSVAARVSNALGGRGVFSVKMFVAGEDVYFSEVLARPHDTGLVTLCTQRYSQFDLHARAVLGLPIDVTLVSPGASAGIFSPVEAQSVVYRGLEKALAVPEANVEVFGRQRVRVGRRLAEATATADTVATALERAKAAAAAVRVEPAEGF